MRTLIFSTREEAAPIQHLLGGRIFHPNQESRVELLRYMDKDESSVTIIVGDVMQMGWCTYHPTHVLFSTNYSQDERVRIQARARARVKANYQSTGGKDAASI